MQTLGAKKVEECTLSAEVHSYMLTPPPPKPKTESMDGVLYLKCYFVAEGFYQNLAQGITTHNWSRRDYKTIPWEHILANQMGYNTANNCSQQ